MKKKFGRNTIVFSQYVIRRDILNVKDGENTQALPLVEGILIYGNKNSDIVILEGIMNSTCYKHLFELAVQLYGDAIAAYYFD